MTFTVILLLLSLLLVPAHLLIDRKYAYTAYEKRLIGIHMLTLLSFIILTYDMLTGGIVVETDVYLNTLMTRLYDKELESVMLWVSMVTDIKGILLFTAILVPILWHRKWFYPLSFYLIGFIGGALIAMAVKHSLERLRPPDHPIDVSLLSYPSGHTALVTIMGLYLFFTYYKTISRGVYKALFLSSVTILILIGAFSRVYIHAHWSSDVLAAILLELSWMSLLVAIFGVFIRNVPFLKRLRIP